MSIEQTVRNEVVFVPVESKEVPGHYEIPSRPEYLVTVDGKVYFKRAARYVNQREHKTSVGSYLAISARVGAKFYHNLVHLMVAEAFHGPPIGEKCFVNHKDGDKHNNHKDNLEWVTRSENLIHAYQSGLRSDNRVVLCVDGITGEATEFYSMSAAARHFGWHVNQAWRMIMNHREIPYLDKYTFMIPKLDVSASSGRDLVARCYVSDRIIVANNYASAEMQTGIKRATIGFNLTKAKEPYGLVKGWVFKFVDDPADWPEYTKEEVEASVSSKTRHGIPIQIHDLKEDTTRICSSLAKFAAELGQHPNTIRRILKRQNGKYEQYDIKELR